jgi:hypothetical protein
MDGIANLADVMLVFSVGIMIALVAAWHIDVTPTATQANMSQIEGMGNNGDTQISDNQYQKMDVIVYRDSATGKYFVVDPNDK